MNKKLYRSNREKMIGGVAGGLAEYFDIDPTIIRVVFVVSLFLGGSGIIAYIILWIIVPEQPIVITAAGTADAAGETTAGTVDPSDAPKSDYDPVAAYQQVLTRRRQKRSAIGGIILIMFGVFILADEFFPRISFEYLLSMALIVIGVALLLNASKKA